LAEGEIVTVLGANGAGKSTTLMTICGVNRCRKDGSVSRQTQFRTDCLTKFVTLGILAGAEVATSSHGDSS